MAFLDDLKKKVMEGSKQVSDKAKEMADTAKLKSQIASEKNKIKTAYAVLGELYYNAHKDDAENEEFAAQTEIVTAALAAIEGLEAEIEAIKAAAAAPAEETVEDLIEEAKEVEAEIEEAIGKSLDEAEAVVEAPTAKVCPICGAEVSADAAFCSKCGCPMK